MSLSTKPAGEREQMLLSVSRARTVAIFSVAFLLLLLNLCLDGAMTSWLPLFILVFLLSGCFFCCCCCTLCAVHMSPTAEARDVPPLSGADGAGATDRSSGMSSSASSSRVGQESPSEEAPLLSLSGQGGPPYRTSAGLDSAA